MLHDCPVEPHPPESVAFSLPPWGPHVRFRRVQTLVREGSPFELRISKAARWWSSWDPAR